MAAARRLAERATRGGLTDGLAGGGVIVTAVCPQRAYGNGGLSGWQTVPGGGVTRSTR